MAIKLGAEQKLILKQALVGLQKSMQRTSVKYSQENKPEFVAMVQKELAKIAGVLAVVDEL